MRQESVGGKAGPGPEKGEMEAAAWFRDGACERGFLLLDKPGVKKERRGLPWRYSG